MTGGVTLNKPTSPSSPLSLHPQTPALCDKETPVGARVGWQSACARWDVANDHLGVPPSILGGGFTVCGALGACMRACVCVSECVYTHSLSQPITVPRSRQLSPPSSSLSLPSLFLLLLHTSSQLAGGSQRGVSAPGPAPLGSHYTTVGLTHTHMRRATNNLSPLSLFICHYATTPFN